MESKVEINLTDIVSFLKKPRAAFTKADIKRFVKAKGIRHINFMYAGGDGRLKTLNFIIHSDEYLDEILTCGERVDGSSLFSYIEASSSDLYVIPRYATAFVDPFAELPTLCLLCSFFNKDGDPLESSPEYTLKKACDAFTKDTGLEFQAMGELEYYVIAPDPKSFPAKDQRGYHESAPFAKFGEFRQKCMLAIAQAGGLIKYGHSEVGNFTEDGLVYEQNEVEFLPCAASEAANQLVIAKWMIRNMGAKYGYDVTFAPKITVGKAGSGLHIHMRLMKNGVNQMLKNGRISDTAKRAIAGMMKLAPQARPPPGGTHERVLGRSQPLRSRARPARLGRQDRHVPPGEPEGDRLEVRHPPEADCRDALARRLCERLPPHGRARGSVPLRLFAEGRRQGRRRDLRQRQHPQEGKREAPRLARDAS